MPMKFIAKFTESAKEDLKYFSARNQRLVIHGVRRYLQDNATTKSKKRKKLITNKIAAWELKLGSFRVFYNPNESGIVEIIAVGFKAHNELFIRGAKVEL